MPCVHTYVYFAAALALLVWLMIMVELYIVYSNFGKGLKEQSKFCVWCICLVLCVQGIDVNKCCCLCMCTCMQTIACADHVCPRVNSNSIHHKAVFIVQLLLKLNTLYNMKMYDEEKDLTMHRL